MPAHLPPLSRRRFLHVAAASAGVLVLRPHAAWAADAADPHRLALISDPHVPEDPAQRHQDFWDPTANFKAVVGQVAAFAPRPSNVVINGDLAYWTGKPGDYRAFGQLLDPLRTLGLPIHVTLGNHDSHAGFNDALADLRPAARPVETKHVLVVELPRANLFLLDSLDSEVPKLKGAGGRLGAAQLKWLNEALDARPDKPALVFCHHNLQDKPDRNGGYFGLADSTALWPALVTRKQVKAFFFGHTHGFHVTKRDGLHTVNLPATGYHPNKDAFLGWLDAKLDENRITLHSHGLDPAHAKHGKTFELPYR